MSQVKDWEHTYKNKGIVQNEILPTVQKAIITLKKNNCKKILDLGCGTGRHTLFLAEHGFKVYAADISETAIKIVRQRSKEKGLGGIHYKITDINNIDFEDNFFDAILCVWSTGHGLKRDVHNSVIEMHRILKPSGFLLADFMSIEDKNYGKGIILEENTFLHDFLDHPDVPHHYSSYQEVEEFLSLFTEKSIKKIEYDDPKYRGLIKAFWVEAKK